MAGVLRRRKRATLTAFVCHAPAMSQHEPLTSPMYFTVGRSGTPPLGFTWRLWASRTSFYLKSRAPGVKHLKLSLHGDDPRHPAGGGFKMAMDTEEAWERAIAEQTAAGWRSGDWPVWFPGRRISDDAVLVARLRWTWDVCNRLGPAPEAGPLKNGAKGFAVEPPPEPGDAVDIDLIVSTAKPYWLNEKSARRDKACFGPLRNDAGQWLTGTAVKRLATHYAPPPTAQGPTPAGKLDEMRAIGSAVDPTGFLWIVEQRMSRSGLTGSANA